MDRNGEPLRQTAPAQQLDRAAAGGVADQAALLQRLECGGVPGGEGAVEPIEIQHLDVDSEPSPRESALVRNLHRPRVLPALEVRPDALPGACVLAFRAAAAGLHPTGAVPAAD